MFVYFNFLNSNESLFYTQVKIRFHHAFSPYFRSEISI